MSNGSVQCESTKSPFLSKLTEKQKLDFGWSPKVCLKCDKEFLSSGKGNRLCISCVHINEVHVHGLFPRRHNLVGAPR